MPRYTKMLVSGLRERKHTIEIWTATALFYNLPLPFKKWLGYIDQFIIFPFEVKRRLKSLPVDTLFVFIDQSLGPWIPLVAHRPHVIHCHDFLAQKSALGEIPENRTRFSGKIYQKIIRNGFTKARYFICISSKTETDLHNFLKRSPLLSEVVYNGLNQDFKPGNVSETRKKLKLKFNIDLEKGYILHVGGNQFYKNREGVIEIYDAWRIRNKKEIPLLMVGAKPSKRLRHRAERSDFYPHIHFISNASDEDLKLFYQGASVLLYPSFYEGFGWPIAEAMASGCPVITTDQAPMNEVGGNSCYYVSRAGGLGKKNFSWATECAKVLQQIMELSPEKRKTLIEEGLKNASRFDKREALEKIEGIYERVLKIC